ncbi:hypothetical protein PoB_005649200 [Plakobranchus ocellatus]|uniref:Uncharacterized protein n=1 Tax=Plakobranchus ocellatus TaxID=259542 RepID=A0AAV4CFG8_9GAST|nr:hypothetical protein PoB_005649200 [Plakobranchus ocellatus]
MNQNHTETLVINVKGVCDSNPNLSFGRDSHVQQVAPGRHPATARKISIDQASKIATWNVRTLHQKGKFKNFIEKMDRIKLKIQGLAAAFDKVRHEELYRMLEKLDIDGKDLRVIDKVRHVELLRILEKLDIDGKDLRVIRNLYWGQTASVRIEGEHSDFKPISCQKLDNRELFDEKVIGRRHCLINMATPSPQGWKYSISNLDISDAELVWAYAVIYDVNGHPAEETWYTTAYAGKQSLCRQKEGSNKKTVLFLA